MKAMVDLRKEQFSRDFYAEAVDELEKKIFILKIMPITQS